MKISASQKKDQEELDLAMAALFTSPSTETALAFARKVRLVELAFEKPSRAESDLLRQLYSDALSLHHAILVLETDPQLVSQNAMARILSGITPALLSLEEYLSGEDTDLWELVIDGSAIFSHLVATTPYVTGAKILLNFRFLKELVKVEERLASLFIASGEDAKKSMEKATTICDSLRKKNLGDNEKPAYIFLFWYCILIISYKHFRDHFHKG